jgi:hypothetical protein
MTTDDHGQQEGDNVDCDPTYQASYSSSKPHLRKQGYLIYLVRDLNLSKEQAELFGSTEILNDVSFAIATMNSKNFSLMNMIWCFLMMPGSWTLHDSTEGVCLATLQKLP